MRRRRHYDATGTRQRESLMEAADLLRDAGADLAAAVRALHVELVLTAHPTEATRRSVLDHQLHVARAARRARRPAHRPVAPPRAAVPAARGADHLVADGRDPPRAPDGRGRGAAQPVLLRGDAARRGARGARGARALLRGARRRARAVVRLVGRLGHGRPSRGRGRDAGAHAHAAPRDGAAADPGPRRRAGPELLALDPRAPISAQLEASLAHDAAELPSARVLRRPNREFEPLRTKLSFITRRISNMLDPLAREPGYADPQELHDDLWLVLDSVGSAHVAHGSLRRLLWQVDVFGFHMASLDVRQSASIVQEAAATLLPGYRDAGEDERMRLLEEAIAEQRRGMDRRTGGPAGELLRVLDTVALAREAYGKRAVPVMVLSMAQSPSDVLAALWLSRRAGAQLRLAPLFETLADLDGAPATMAHALRHAGLPRQPARPRRPPADHARLLRLGEGLGLRREPVGAARGAGAARRPGRRRRARARAVPRARRLAVARRRAHAPRDPRPAARLAVRPHPHHGAGRDRVRPLRRPRAGRAVARADAVGGAARLDARAAARAARVAGGDGADGRALARALPRAGLRRPRLPALLRAGDADRRADVAQHRLAAVQARVGRDRGAARDPVGVRVDAEPPAAALLVRRRARP